MESEREPTLEKCVHAAGRRQENAEDQRVQCPGAGDNKSLTTLRSEDWTYIPAGTH